MDGRYEIEWSASNMPHVLDIETMSVVDDGTRLIGQNREGQMVKALKMKLKRGETAPIPEDEIYSPDFDPDDKRKLLEGLKKELQKFK